MTTRVAAFDCGTNSLRLLIADLDPATATSTELVREMRIVRLGEGVDRSGRISEAAMDRVFTAVEEYAELVAAHDVEATRFCATSAARDAENSQVFMDGVHERIGVRPEVLDGDAEAEASFSGAVRDLPGLPGPLLVCDIGGGSTELILGTVEEGIIAAHSLDIGSVRLNERHLADDPPTRAQIEAAVADIDAALDGCRVDPARAGALIGVAGTVTTLAAGVLDLAAYDRDLIHHSVLPAAAVHATVSRLLAMTVAERRSLGYMHPGRADVIGAGALILDRLLRRTPVQTLLVSEHDILDGIAWSLAATDPASGKAS
ncbi:MAG: Ppx/GppA phosphatase family protein [Marmoricola sp.]